MSTDLGKTLLTVAYCECGLQGKGVHSCHFGSSTLAICGDFIFVRHCRASQGPMAFSSPHSLETPHAYRYLTAQRVRGSRHLRNVCLRYELGHSFRDRFDTLIEKARKTSSWNLIVTHNLSLAISLIPSRGMLPPRLALIATVTLSSLLTIDAIPTSPGHGHHTSLLTNGQACYLSVSPVLPS